MQKEIWTLLGAATAVAVPLIFNTAKEFVWETKKRKKEERYIIIQLIFILDKYISECNFLAYNDGIYSQELKFMSTDYDKPDLKLSAVKGEFKYLSTDMLYRLHSIESKHIQVIKTLANLDDDYYQDPPEFPGYYAERQELYAKLGLYVIELSEDICRTFKIRHTSWEGGINPAESIRNRLIKIRSSRSKITLRRMESYASRVAARARKSATGRE